MLKPSLLPGGWESKRNRKQNIQSENLQSTHSVKIDLQDRIKRIEFLILQRKRKVGKHIRLSIKFPPVRILVVLKEKLRNRKLYVGNQNNIDSFMKHSIFLFVFCLFGFFVFVCLFLHLSLNGWHILLRESEIGHLRSVVLSLQHTTEAPTRPTLGFLTQ